MLSIYHYTREDHDVGLIERGAAHPICHYLDSLSEITSNMLTLLNERTGIQRHLLADKIDIDQGTV